MKKNLFTLTILFMAVIGSAQVAVNTDGSSPDASAILDVKSTTKGLLIPRMTAAERNAIANPAQGLMVYVTDDSLFYYYKNSSWIKVGKGSSNWDTNGTDVFTLSDVGIGTDTPGAKLTIKNSSADTSLSIVNINNNDLRHYGSYKRLSGAGNGFQYGSYQFIDNSGLNDHFGSYNYLSGNGNGFQYGSYQYIDNSGSGRHYGIYNSLSGTGIGNKYGIYSLIGSSAGGTHYGVYSDALGSSHYAGYFKGRIYVSDRVGIGTESPNELLEVADTGNNQGRMIVSDGNGSNRYVLLFISPDATDDTAQIESYKYGASAGGITLKINTDGDGETIFGGNVLPESHKTENLGSSSKAWGDIYYNNLINMGAAAYTDREVTAEILNYPPKPKPAGAFDETTEKGLKELDPGSVPDDLKTGYAILTDEMTTYNYKANYEQQIQIGELKEQLKAQRQIIQKLMREVEELKKSR